LRVNGLSGLGPIPEGTPILIPSPTKIGVTPYRTNLLLEQLDQMDSEPDDGVGDGLESPATEEAPSNGD